MGCGMSDEKAKDLVLQKKHILTYIAEIAGQLSDMAHRADCDDLGEDLRKVVTRAQNLHNDRDQPLL